MNAAQEPDVDLSPVGSLTLLWPAIPDGLVSAAARLRLEAAAARLAPIARIALELRLGEGQDEVDLHQYVSHSAADAAVLRRYLSQCGDPAPNEESTRRFLHAWADDAGGVRTDLDGFFLEWDGAGAHHATPPAIFIPVQHRHGGETDVATRRLGIASHIDTLGLAGSHAADLLRAIPVAISVSYIGFMLGRGDAVRVNLRGIRPNDLESVLAELGWPGDAGLAKDRFALLVGLTGQVAVALDFTPAIQPTIGFEAALPDFPAGEPRWHELLDQLCLDGLCTHDKMAALETLGARLYPEDKEQNWPASWIAAAMVAPPTCAPWYERRLSHVKVTIGAQGEVAAKAYVSAQHHWRRGVSPTPQPRQIAAGLSTGTAIQDASARAGGFLLAARQQDDFWRDFRLVNGASDEWVTAFVGYALATSGALPDAVAAQAAEALLRRQRPEGGWGYNKLSPADADSTTWVLKFLGAVGCAGPETARANAFLLSHLRPAGGISTYAAATSLRFRGAAGATDDKGWRSGHLCVAANAAAVLGEPLIGHLLSAQGEYGEWAAYWWRGDIFATALAIESLGSTETAIESRARAMAWARQRAASAKTAFDRAWLVRILSSGGTAERAQARAMAVELAAEQRPDGSWDASAEMLFPDPAELRRRPDAPIVLDEARLFTVASVLLALASVQTIGDGM